MKRIFLLVAASLMLAAPMFSQPGGGRPGGFGGGMPGGFGGMGGGAPRAAVDNEAYMKKIQKSDSEMNKKGTKAQYWLDRGKIMMDTEIAVSKNLYVGINGMLLSVMFGRGTNDGEVTLGVNTFTKTTYAPYVVTYAGADGAVRAWDITYVVYEGALDKAVEAYKKAYEIDPKVADKVNLGLTDAINEMLKQAESYYAIQKYDAAGDLFMKVYELSQHPAYKEGVNGEAIFNSGLSYYFGNQFQKSYDAYQVAKSKGIDQKGETYYYMYHAYKGLVGNDKAKLKDAKEFLMEGMQKYPEETRIIESLTDVYVEMGENPADMIPIVKGAIEKDQNNASLWNGLGRIYESLGMTNDALAAFNKVAELLPNNYVPFYWLGTLYVRLGDELNAAMGSKTYSGQDDYEADLNKALDMYKKSVQPLERAHELAPDEIYFVELLKNVTFRLRDIDGMMDKYNVYKALFDEMATKEEAAAPAQ